jgi:hypothetical protein
MFNPGTTIWAFYGNVLGKPEGKTPLGILVMVGKLTTKYT